MGTEGKMSSSQKGGAPSVGIKTCVVQADLSLPVPVEWAEAGTVEKLTIFPVKSCMGTVVHEAQATKEGGMILVDRHFMVANAKNRLVSGRKYSQMVLIE